MSSSGVVRELRLRLVEADDGALVAATEPSATSAAPREHLLPETLRNKLLVTPREAAQLLSMSRAKLYPLLTYRTDDPDPRKIFSVRDGGSRRIPVSALEAYVKRLEEN